MKKTLILITLLACVLASNAQTGQLECDSEKMEYNISGLSVMEEEGTNKVAFGVFKKYTAFAKTNDHIWVTVSNKNKPKIDVREIQIKVDFVKEIKGARMIYARAPIDKKEKNVKRLSVDFNIPPDCTSGDINIYYLTKDGSYIFVSEEFIVNGSVSPPAPKPVLTECSVCGLEESPYSFTTLKGDVSKRCSKDESRYTFGFKTAKTSSQIFYYDLIKTGDRSYAVLKDKYNSETYMINANSSVLVNDGTVKGVAESLRLTAGNMWVNVKRLTRGKTVKIEATRCITNIKGTIVGFEETEGESRVWLFAGDVEVTSKETGKTQTLKAGQRSAVGKNGTISVKSFNIEEGAKKFGIDMKEINSHYTNTDTKQPSDATTPPSTSPYARYGVKSGIIKRIATTDKDRTYTTTWFDDYGRLERTENTKKEIKEGGKWKNSANYVFVNLYIDDKQIRLDPYHKSATTLVNNEINFSDPKSKGMNRNNMRKKGTGEVNGKKCDIYTCTQHKFSGDATVEFYVWQGIVLKKVEYAKDGTSTTLVESMEVPATVDANKFKVPTDYKTN